SRTDPSVARSQLTSGVHNFWRMVIASSVPARFGRHTEGGLKVGWFHRCPQSLTEDAVMVENGRLTSPRRYQTIPSVPVLYQTGMYQAYRAIRYGIANLGSN
ncbi:hypothetical protein B296_00054396, partial [Ensete ventricosum]